MKLEVGKSYVNRLGEAVRIIAREPYSKSIYEYWDGDQWYMENGQWSNTSLEYPQDLIAEAPEAVEDMPATDTDTQPDDGGLASAKSLREWYAGMALIGAIAEGTERVPGSTRVAGLAEFAFMQADAMIRASRK